MRRTSIISHRNRKRAGNLSARIEDHPREKGEWLRKIIAHQSSILDNGRFGKGRRCQSLGKLSLSKRERGAKFVNSHNSAVGAD